MEKALSPLASWLTPEELAAIETQGYWNDRKIEQEKALWTASPEDPRPLRYLREESRLEEAFLTLLEQARALGFPATGTVLDLGAGVCWTAAILARESQVTRVVAVDISRHRLAEIAPHVIAMYGAPPGKIERVVGSFYDVRLETSSVAAVILCEAFHHAFDVGRLLEEVNRVLEPGGWLLISGEQPISARVHARRMAGEIFRAARRGKLPRLGFQSLFSPDPVLGDHYYRVADYVRLLTRHGFTTTVKRLPYKLCTESRVRGCNFIARKS